MGLCRKDKHILIQIVTVNMDVHRKSHLHDRSCRGTSSAVYAMQHLHLSLLYLHSAPRIEEWSLIREMALASREADNAQNYKQCKHSREFLMSSAAQGHIHGQFTNQRPSSRPPRRAGVPVWLIATWNNKVPVIPKPSRKGHLDEGHMSALLQSRL